MAFKFTKQKIAEKAKLVESLVSAREELERSIDKFNETVQEARNGISEAVTAYNEKLEAAREFISDLHSQLSQDWSDKSERWQEGDAGQAASDWIDGLEGLPAEFEDIEIETPEPLEIGDFEDHATLLDEMPEAPE